MKLRQGLHVRIKHSYTEPLHPSLCLGNTGIAEDDVWVVFDNGERFSFTSSQVNVMLEPLDHNEAILEEA